MSDSSTLKEIVNAPEIIPAFGRSYEIAKFTLGPMTQAFEYVGPMGYLLKKLNEFPRDGAGKIVANQQQMLDFAITAISISGPSVMGLISIATKEPIEWLEVQDPIDGIAIFAKVVEKNLSFFSQENMDRVMLLFNGLAQQIQTPGGDVSTS